MKTMTRSSRSPRPSATPLDAIDRRLLDLLQKDNQVTNIALADKVGLSPPACLKRVRRLRAEKIIVKDVAVLDPDSVGQSIVAFVGVELDRQREDVLAAFERKIAAESAVQQCYFVSGEIDYLLTVLCRDMEAYNAFARRVLANEHNIKRFRTSFSLSRVKYETRIPLD
ncbi:transcriptional regulator, AsnC family [Rhizobiales bacterium GAS191]|jgi:Lrp/AsnC family leucine-responsive transcriptional regulator|nr:transcriptional regulator, AsnC family [Rhizobiales bacterium GAS113]SEB75662.1 transcriptional regulator, AsnC family [Rhizobiales bacterium GAS188]SED52496.1 transcriptional regulator, AsnC family [Rhizobiales bacterium GAS191]